MPVKYIIRSTPEAYPGLYNELLVPQSEPKISALKSTKAIEIIGMHNSSFLCKES